MLYLSFLLSAALSMAETQDTLQTVTVVADRGVVVSRTDTIPLKNSSTISETLLLSPSLFVNDNGGFSGLKTVSLRGLGSPHTVIYYDGVRVGNVQTGQADLSMLDASSIGGAVIDFAQNSISFNTEKPVFKNSPVAGKFSLAGGSFGTWQPSGRLDFRLSEKISLSANSAAVLSRGDFPYGEGLIRENNDIRQIRSGVDLFGKMTDGDWHVKAYYNGAERGAPGSVSWPSTDRQKDRNAFVQGVFRKQLSPVYFLNVSAKAALDRLSYTSSWGDSCYDQKEFQLNSSHKFNVCNWCSLSLAADLSWDGLSSTSYDASRTGVVTSLASAFHFGRLKTVITLEYDGAFDKGAGSRNIFSPAMDVKLNVCDGLNLGAFARRAYRVPLFNELYYVGYGNPELLPEDAFLSDIGLDFCRGIGPNWQFKAKLDLFLNLLKNKIVSAPSPEDPNVWAPYNIGSVHSAGCDASAGFSYRLSELSVGFLASYTFQDAVDKTAGSDSYGSRIPYISKHSLSLSADVEWRKWGGNAVWALRSGRCDSYGDMPDWNTLDVNFFRVFSLGDVVDMKLFVSGRNLFDCRYELSSAYPMPGRSFSLGLNLIF